MPDRTAPATRHIDYSRELRNSIIITCWKRDGLHDCGRCNGRGLHADRHLERWTKTCTLTGDLSAGISIDCDNVILNGDSHTLTEGGGDIYSRTDNGIYISGRTGITASNTCTIDFARGIYLLSPSGISLRDGC